MYLQSLHCMSTVSMFKSTCKLAPTRFPCCKPIDRHSLKISLTSVYRIPKLPAGTYKSGNYAKYICMHLIVNFFRSYALHEIILHCYRIIRMALVYAYILGFILFHFGVYAYNGHTYSSACG